MKPQMCKTFYESQLHLEPKNQPKNQPKKLKYLPKSSKHFILYIGTFLTTVSAAQELTQEYIELSRHVYNEMHHKHEVCMKVAENRHKENLKNNLVDTNPKTLAAKLEHLKMKEKIGIPSIREKMDLFLGLSFTYTLEEDQEKCKTLMPSIEDMANEIERRSLINKIPKYQQ